MHKKSKHIETKFHFIRDKTEDGTISIHYVPTDKMAADIFKNSLPVPKVENFRAFDGNRLYAISSSRSGGVSTLIQVEELNLVLLGSLTFQIKSDRGKLIQVTNTDINESSKNGAENQYLVQTDDSR